MSVDRPLFLIGTGRCGSSLLLRLLGYHPDLAWISHYTSYLPGHAAWGALARVHDLPGLAGLLPTADGRRWIPQPTEHYALLEAATDHLFTAPRPLVADELTHAARQGLRDLVDRHTRAQGKPRFVLKHTGFPRVAYLHAAFPEGKFVHVKRDGRSVASSLCRVDWWSGEGHWGWGPLSDDDVTAYVESGCHELVLAGLYWKVLMRRLEDARADVPAEQLLEVRYDELVADPVGTMQQIVDFCELPWTSTMADRVAATPMTSDDTRWRKHLDDEEQALLHRVLADDLAHHGFAP